MSENPVLIDKEPKSPEIFPNFFNWCKLILISMILMMILIKENEGGLDTTSSKNLELLIGIGLNTGNLSKFLQVDDFVGLVRGANSKNLELLIDNGIINIGNLKNLIQNENFLNLVRSANPENLELLIDKGLSRDILLEFLEDKEFMTLIQSAYSEDLEKLNKKLSDRINS